MTFFSLSFRQAAILQQTADYIFTLEQEKTRLLQQNSQLKRIIQVKLVARLGENQQTNRSPPPVPSLIARVCVAACRS